MNILVLAAIFPPHVIGGAELSAFNMCRLLASRGHKVSVLTAAEVNEPEVWGEENPAGFTVYRLHFPRAYTMFGHREAKKWQKPLWHLKDYFSPVSRKIVARVMDAVKPDHVNVHIISGIGFGALREVAKRGVSVVWFLHDSNLACIKSTMFHGKCAGRNEWLCNLTSWWKGRQLAKIKRLGFVSPSAVHLCTLQRVVPAVAARMGKTIRNVPDPLPHSLPVWKPAKHVRFLYLGQLVKLKGVALLLEALESLAMKYDFSISVFGRGQMEAELKARFGMHNWVKFAGFVKQDEVARQVRLHDVLCVPSLWIEPYGRVTAQALQLGTPVVGSATGGTVELVRDGETGLLVKSGDVDAWVDALESVLKSPKKLSVMRVNTKKYVQEFDEDKIGEAYEAFVEKVRKG